MSKRKPSRRTSRRTSRKNNRTRNIAVIAAPLAVIATGIIGAALYKGDVKPDAYGCYASQKQHVSAIFVDNSLNSLTPAQLRDYGDAFAKTYDEAPANARIALYSTASDKAGSMATPRFIMCKPAANKDEQKRIGAPDKPAAYLKRRADDAKVRFAALTEDVLRDTQNAAQLAKQSPILEELRAISHSTDFQGDTRSFTVITDGIQNSAIGQFCVIQGDMPKFSRFTQRSDYEVNIKPASFNGTSISLLLAGGVELPQPAAPYCTNVELQQWWHAYFTQNGADNINIVRLRAW